MSGSGLLYFLVGMIVEGRSWSTGGGLIRAGKQLVGDSDQIDVVPDG